MVGMAKNPVGGELRAWGDEVALRRATRHRMSGLCVAAVAGVLAAAPASEAAPVRSGLSTCDESLKASFRPDAQTSVVLVKAFKAGDPLVLGDAASSGAPRAASDLCLVKLNVGPGHPGPVDAPSTSPGIGIEIWLPAKAKWNGRVHALGGGGWQGGAAGSPTAIASRDAARIADIEGAVSSTTDTGHAGRSGDFAVLEGDFAMKPDGTINTTLWRDFVSRGIHQQALKTKALATAFYGTAPRRAYWDGGSTGGRQGLYLAQNYPSDFDGVIALFPALHWTRMTTAGLYPQIVFQRDLGGKPLSRAQLDLASNAAIGACDTVGGQHLGYILDPIGCAYDPTQDAKVLCAADGGDNATAACLTPAQAAAMNKIWYGMTSDGSAPNPAQDNGWSMMALTSPMGGGTHRWFGVARGTSMWFRLNGLASPDGAFPIAADTVALELQDPSIADPTFVNATSRGQARWRRLSFAELSGAYDRGLALQREFGNINTDNPDLSAFKRRGGKILMWHGLADQVIPAQGTINYYNQVAARLGDMDKVHEFSRLYLVPGAGHAVPNGTSNPAAAVPNFGPTQMYDLLTDWVENGVAPGQVVLQGRLGGETRGMPVCAYPQAIRYVGGDPKLAGSYACSPA